MKKYKVIIGFYDIHKGTPYYVGEYYDLKNNNITEYLLLKGNIIEIDDYKLQFKVGDYVVYDKGKFSKQANEYVDIEFLKIDIISKAGNKFYYNGHLGEYLRKPTQEELEKYFR